MKKLICMLLILPLLAISGLAALAAGDLAVTSASLPDGSVGKAYNAILKASGADKVTWSISAGRLPDGLHLNIATGAITGSPKLAGVHSFAVMASDSSFNRASRELYIAVGANSEGSGQPGAGQSQNESQPDQPNPTDPRKPLPETCIWSLDGSASHRQDLGDGMYEDIIMEFQFVNMDSRSPAGDCLGSVYAEANMDAGDIINSMISLLPPEAAMNMHFDLSSYALSQGIVLGVQNYYAYSQTNFWPTVKNEGGSEITPSREEYICVWEGQLAFKSDLSTGATFNTGGMTGSVGNFDYGGTDPLDVKFYFVIEPDSVWGDAYYITNTGTRQVKIYAAVQGEWFSGMGNLTRQPGGMDNRAKYNQDPPKSLAEQHNATQTGDTLQDHAGASQKVVDVLSPGDLPPSPKPSAPPKPGEPGHPDYPLAPKSKGMPLAPVLGQQGNYWNASESGSTAWADPSPAACQLMPIVLRDGSRNPELDNCRP